METQVITNIQSHNGDTVAYKGDLVITFVFGNVTDIDTGKKMNRGASVVDSSDPIKGLYGRELAEMFADLIQRTYKDRPSWVAFQLYDMISVLKEREEEIEKNVTKEEADREFAALTMQLLGKIFGNPFSKMGDESTDDSDK